MHGCIHVCMYVHFLSPVGVGLLNYWDTNFPAESPHPDYGSIGQCREDPRILLNARHHM